MSIELITLAWKTDLPTGKKMVLLALADQSNDQGECYPSVATLAKKCSMDERTVQRNIRSLEELDLLTSHPRFGRSTVYKLHREVMGTPLTGATHNRKGTIKEPIKRGKSRVAKMVTHRILGKLS